MFDIGFLEIVLISVVALLILGPDKLPGAIRTMGLWLGRLRRNFDNIKRDIEKEIGADEIRRQLRNEAILEKFNESKKQITDGFGAIKQEAEAIKKEAEAVRSELDIKEQVEKQPGKSADSGKSEDNDTESDTGSATQEDEKPGYLKGGDGIIHPYPLDKVPARKGRAATTAKAADTAAETPDHATDQNQGTEQPATAASATTESTKIKSTDAGNSGTDHTARKHDQQ